MGAGTGTAGPEGSATAGCMAKGGKRERGGGEGGSRGSGGKLFGFLCFSVRAGVYLSLSLSLCFLASLCVAHPSFCLATFPLSCAFLSSVPFRTFSFVALVFVFDAVVHAHDLSTSYM